jgi:hypothetical protein
VVNADLILVMDDGTIAEAGTHEELVRRRGIYCSLVAAQTGAPPRLAGPTGVVQGEIDSEDEQFLERTRVSRQPANKAARAPR